MGLKEKLLGVGSDPKNATLILYWADSQELLTYTERMMLSNLDTVVVDMTPQEVLLQDTKTGRKIVVRGITDEHLPIHLNGAES